MDTADNEELKGINIDGEEVKQITIGGDIVWSTNLLYDDFADGSLDSEWNTFGTANGNISESGSSCVISQTAGGGSNTNIIGIYSTLKLYVGDVLKVRAKNTSQRHAAIIGLGDGAGQAFPHGGGENDGPAVTLYSRADNISANTSFQDENGNTNYATPGPQDYTSYRDLRIERPDTTTVKIYVDGSLESTFNGEFGNAKRVYFAADGYNTPNKIEIDSVEVTGLFKGLSPKTINGKDVIVDRDEYGKWVCVQNYEHYGGNDPEPMPGSTFPQLPNGKSDVSTVNNLGGNGELRHVDNISQYGTWDVDAVKLEAVTDNHSRKINYFTENQSVIDAIVDDSTDAGHSELKSNVTKYGDHTAFLPDDMSSDNDNETTSNGDRIFGWEFPMYGDGSDGTRVHWAMSSNGNRWEVDDYPGNASNTTVHRVWVRTNVSI